MKPLFYIIRKSFKNHLKQLKHKPGILILYIFMILFLFGMIAMSIFMPNRNISNLQNKKEIFGAIVTGTTLFIVIWGIKQGSVKGNSFFRMSDVNLAFTSPISPQKILIYGFIKQLYATFFAVFFLIFQLPNLKNHFPLVNFGGLIIIATAFLLIFSLSIIGLLTYSVSSRSLKARSYVDKLTYGLTGLLLVGYVFTLVNLKDPKAAGLAFLNHKAFTYIPFIGWFKQMFMASLNGIDKTFFFNLGIILLFLGLLMYIMYKLNTDYYEDVLSATEQKEEMLRNKKEGKANFSLGSTKAKIIKNKKVGTGASSIYYRHLLEYRKSGIPFIDKGTFIAALSGIMFGYFMPGKNINAVLYFTVYMLFFFMFQGKWAQELSKPYIYMLPFKSSQKIFYATLSDLIKHTIDGVVLFTAAGIVFKADIITVILCALCYSSFAAIYLYGDILSRRLLGSVHSKNMQVFLKLFTILLIILPGIIISIIASMMLKDLIIAKYVNYIVLFGYNIIVSIILAILGRGIFDHLEMN